MDRKYIFQIFEQTTGNNIPSVISFLNDSECLIKYIETERENLHDSDFCSTIYDYVKTIASQDSPFKFLLAKILIRTRLSTFLTIKRKGYRLRFYPSANSRLLWIDKNYENQVIDFIHDYLRDGDIMIDAGANIGVITLESSVIVGNKGKIYSIEPHPKTFRFLRGNIQLNSFDNIEIFNVVLGNQDDIVLFSDKISDDQNSVSDDKNGIKLLMKRLDDLIHSNQINLLKIDVEDMRNLSYSVHQNY